MKAPKRDCRTVVIFRTCGLDRSGPPKANERDDEMVRKIFVAPAHVGWSVRSDGFANDMLFFSGAKAESTARNLAEKIAHSGQAAQVEVRLRDGSLAGRFVCSPASVRVREAFAEA
jgi:hypothetical protein